MDSENLPTFESEDEELLVDAEQLDGFEFEFEEEDDDEAIIFEFEPGEE